MSEFLINIRLNQKIISSLKVNPEQTIQQIKQYISAKTNKLINQFYLYINGQLLPQESNQTTLAVIGIQNQSTIDIFSLTQSIQNIINVKFEYGMQIYMIDIFQQQTTIQSVKAKIGVVIGLRVSQFDLVINNQNFIQQNEKVSNYRIGNDTIISVKRRLLIEGLKGSFKSKLVQSVVSSQQHLDERQQNQKSNDDQENENKLRFLQMRTRCSASLHSIYDAEQKVKPPMKHSSIQPYIMHKNQQQMVEQKQKIKRKIEDIKQTISFGSLQQNRPQETQVEVINENLSIYYRFCCPFGCKINNLKQKLAKAQRIEIQNLQILQTEDQALVQELTQVGQLLCLKYKIKD